MNYKERTYELIYKVEELHSLVDDHKKKLTFVDFSASASPLTAVESGFTLHTESDSFSSKNSI